MVTLAPELPGALEAIEDLAAAGVLVSLGHSACSFDIAEKAADAGARLVTHLGNAMGPFGQRRPGLLGAALSDDRLAVSVIADLVHVHPALIRIAFRSKGAARTVLVTDAVATGAATASAPATPTTATATGTGTAIATAGDRADGPPRMADGTLVGSVLRLDRALSNVVNEAGISAGRRRDRRQHHPGRSPGPRRPGRDRPRAARRSRRTRAPVGGRDRVDLR